MIRAHVPCTTPYQVTDNRKVAGKIPTGLKCFRVNKLSSEVPLPHNGKEAVKFAVRKKIQ